MAGDRSAQSEISQEMQRVTITLDDDLMDELDAIIAARGYQNRSEAIRDLARAGIREAAENVHPRRECVAALVYVYDHEALYNADALRVDRPSIILVGRLPRTYPFSDNGGTGAYATNASARTSESLTPFAGPVTASGTFAAPNKGRWIFVPTSGSSL